MRQVVVERGKKEEDKVEDTSQESDQAAQLAPPRLVARKGLIDVE